MAVFFLAAVTSSGVAATIVDWSVTFVEGASTMVAVFELPCGVATISGGCGSCDH